MIKTTIYFLAILILFSCIGLNKTQEFKGEIFVECAKIYTPSPTHCYDFKNGFKEDKIYDTISDESTLNKIFQFLDELILDTTDAYTGYMNTRLYAKIIFKDSTEGELCFGSGIILYNKRKVNYNKDLINILINDIEIEVADIEGDTTSFPPPPALLFQKGK